MTKGLQWLHNYLMKKKNNNHIYIYKIYESELSFDEKNVSEV